MSYIADLSGLNLCNKDTKHAKELHLSFRQINRNSIFFSTEINHKDVDSIKIFIPDGNVVFRLGF